MTRRDRVFLTGKRAAKLNTKRSAWAWQLLAAKMEVLGEKDVPKFADLLRAIRTATISGAQADR